LTATRFALIPLLFIALASRISAADTLTFQQGDGGAYSTTDATFINDTAAVNHGSDVLLAAVVFDMVQQVHAMIRFPDIVGNNAGQIPPGSSIISATLTMTVYNSNPPASATDIQEILADWGENTIDGVAWNALPDPKLGPIIGTLPEGTSGDTPSGDVTSAVQDWASGAANRGVMISQPLVFGFYVSQYHSDDAAVPSMRPKLTVEFSSPVAVEPTTWGRVKALYR
jgi:hypothetical protein